MIVTVDKYTRSLLTIIAVLLTVLAAGLWFETPTTMAPAQAKIPDSGLQFQRVIDQTGRITTSLDNLTELLISGQVRVQIVEPLTEKKIVPIKKPAPVITQPPVER